MKHIKFIVLAISVTSLVCSCGDDWLMPDAKSFYTPENVFTDEEGLSALLITMRKDIKKECTDNFNYFSAEFAASDLASPWSQLDFYKLTPSNSEYYPFLSFYINAYGYIKNTNVLISRIDDIKWSDENKRNAVLAEGLWFRAYWYYRLINSYGDVPFINNEIVSPKLDFQTHSRWTILNKIQEDLEFAAKWLPQKADPGAISKGAAEHLLTKVYMANLNFDKAIEAATKVINGPYALMTERFGTEAGNPVRNLIWDLHRPKNFNIPANTETILAIVDRYEAPAEARSKGLHTMRMYNPGWFQAEVIDSEGKSGMLAAGAMYDSLGRGNANVRPTSHYQYDIWNIKGEMWNNTSDIRRADINWVDTFEILYNNPRSVDFGKSVKKEYFANPIDTFRNFYAIPHYIMYVPMDDPQAQPVGGNGDWYIFRLAETYLLRAEAYYWKNDLSSAANDLNKVRTRAKAVSVEPRDVTLDFILDERARELYAEEPRHSELIRISYILAKLNQNGYSLNSFSEKNFYYDRVMKYNKTYEQKIMLIGNTANMAPFHALWPVPDKVIIANTLGIINQNIGYNGAEKNLPPLETIE
ncbi:RagB/SusD family nutrient uptake outer membrane protein [Parabacteroides chinchillae]